LVERKTIAPHDCIGSNLSVHIRNNKEVVRVVPNENENVNETWISDRDRFSYEALSSADRLSSPMIKTNGEWQETDWNTALQATVSGINRIIAESGPEQFGVLASPVSTLEELYLLQKLSRQLRIPNIDHRLRQIDFSAPEEDPVFPWLGQTISELEKNDAVLLIGSNIRKDQPIAAHRLRKASHNGMKLMHINAVDYDFYIPVAAKLIVNPKSYTNMMAGIAKALVSLAGQQVPEGFDKLSAELEVSSEQQKIAQNLFQGKQTSVLLGPLAMNHPDFANIRQLATLIAQLTNSKVGYLPEAGNCVGAWIAGAVPHRVDNGQEPDQQGLDVAMMLQKGLQGYLLLNVEPEYDVATPNLALRSLESAEFVVSMSCYINDTIKQYANVVLPITPFTETSGTFVNAEATWQSFEGVVQPLGDARPAWKVLRVLGNLFNAEGFDYVDSNEILSEIKANSTNLAGDNSLTWRCPGHLATSNRSEITRISEIQMYCGDHIQRRAKALQSTFDADVAAIRVNARMAEQLGLSEGVNAVAKQNGSKVTLPIIIDNMVSDNSVLIYGGLDESVPLDANFTPVTIESVS